MVIKTRYLRYCSPVSTASGGSAGHRRRRFARQSARGCWRGPFQCHRTTRTTDEVWASSSMPRRNRPILRIIDANQRSPNGGLRRFHRHQISDRVPMEVSFLGHVYVHLSRKSDRTPDFSPLFLSLFFTFLSLISVFYSMRLLNFILPYAMNYFLAASLAIALLIR